MALTTTATHHLHLSWSSAFPSVSVGGLSMLLAEDRASLAPKSYSYQSLNNIINWWIIFISTQSVLCLIEKEANLSFDFTAPPATAPFFLLSFIADTSTSLQLLSFHSFMDPAQTASPSAMYQTCSCQGHNNLYILVNSHISPFLTYQQQWHSGS